MVQIKRHQILDRELTGASLDSNLGFYDETYNYSISDQVSWQNKLWEALVNITGTTEGDLSNSPDLQPGQWKKLVDETSLYSVYPSASQTFTNTRITINLDTERSSNSKFSVSNGEITFNNSGDYIISMSASAYMSSTGGGIINNPSSGSNAFLQLNSGSGYSDMPHIKISMYHANTSQGQDTGSITFPLSANTGDKLRMQIVRYSGSDGLSTIPDGCNILIF